MYNTYKLHENYIVHMYVHATAEQNGKTWKFVNYSDAMRLLARKSLESYEKAFEMLQEDFPALNISRDDDSLYSIKNKMAAILHYGGDQERASKIRMEIEV